MISIELVVNSISDPAVYRAVSKTLDDLRSHYIRHGKLSEVDKVEKDIRKLDRGLRLYNKITGLIYL